ELYWNATGNFWSFSIENAVAQVTLPNGANIVELAVYTGSQGATDTDAKFTRSSDNTAYFRATRSFKPREGMSISVSFEKGVLIEPSLVQRILYFISDQRSSIFPLLSVLLILAYYYFAWDAVGRDPKKGTIIPLFAPPEGFSPALSHFIHYMGWKKSGWTAYSAALVSLVTHGLITNEKDQKKKINVTHLQQSARNLPRGEAVIEKFLKKKRVLKVSKSSGKSINSNKGKFIKAIISENQNAYFFNNFIYSGTGIALSILVVIAMIIGGILAPAQGLMILSASIGLIVLAIAFSSIGGAGIVGKIVVFSWFSIVGINMAGGMTSLFSSMRLDMPLIATISIGLINALFIFLMRAPTVHGRKIMDQIDGFKMYLETAEKNRLNFNREPDFTIERFEEILPYAIALGVEKPWSNRLEGEFSRNAIEQPKGGYHPNWYSGSNFGSSNLSKSVAGIATGMSAAMIASQPSSSSSSGGGGGGSSGGGGGGGGGGGW
ncbi:Putative membrane protein precursor, partial [hydrothermal vent metagenome]